MKEHSDLSARQAIKKKHKALDKCCGNCRDHNACRYPENIFCFMKLCDNENPVRSIFDTCGEWVVKEQDCLCVEDALKALHDRNRSCEN